MENNNSVIEISDVSIVEVSDVSIISVSSDGTVHDDETSIDVSLITISDDDVSLVFAGGNGTDVGGNGSIDEDVTYESESAHIVWGNISQVASFDGRSFTFDSSSTMVLPQPRTSTRLVQRIAVDTSIELENGV